MNDAVKIATTQIATVHAADWAVLERLYADDVRYRDPDGGLAGRAAVVARLREQSQGLAGWSYEVRAAYSDDGDGAVVEWTLSSPAPLTLDVVTAYEVLDGRIVSERNYWDNLSLLTQLGLMPAAG